MLSATGRKFLRGPRGTGFLYVRRALIEGLDPPLARPPRRRVAARRLVQRSARTRGASRTGSRTSPTKIGLGAAADYALDVGLDAIRERVRALAGDAARAARRDRRASPSTTSARERSAIVTFAVDGHPTAEVVAALRERGVNTSLSPATYARLDFGPRGLVDLVRASVHYYNDLGDIDRLVDVVETL